MAVSRLKWPSAYVVGERRRRLVPAQPANATRTRSKWGVKWDAEHSGSAPESTRGPG
ncbi:hypothetical protein ACFOLD_14450 [Kocuria carniphila]|uniref:hypothetical protein n=1 Tax=Kocuria carniphila TaxID=262208 RepID=UPI00361B0781